MDWLPLLLLVPLVVIPLVFLGGFGGCGFSAQLDAGPPAPSGLMATVAGIDQIDLSWNDNGTGTTHFNIIRTKPGGSSITIEGIPAVAGDPPILNKYSDSVVLKKGTYEYQVFAVVLSGKVSNGVNLNLTLDWEISFDQGPTEMVGTNEAGWRGRCMVQRINAATSLVPKVRPKVRITVRGSTDPNTELNLNAVSISQATPVGDLWDSAVDLKPVLFGGSSSILVPGGMFKQSDETKYLFNKDNDLIIAFDVNPSIGSGNVRHRDGIPGAQLYYRAGTSQAGVADRLPDYLAENPDRVFIVEKIEVLSQV